MTILDFSKELLSNNEKRYIHSRLATFICEFSDNVDFPALESFIKSIDEENFTDFGGKIGMCRNECMEKIKKEDDEKYKSQIESAKNLLDTLSAKYQEEVQRRKKQSQVTDTESAIEQNAKVTTELNNKVVSAQKLIEDANKKIENFDGKIFSLLLNTVAILGIFVAIAFTGFGVSSFFSSVNLEEAIKSTDAFIKNIFFIMLALFASYNLLLILVYFIFKLSRPLNSKKCDATTSNDNENTFSSINLVPFWIVDGIVFVMTVALFVASFYV